MSLLSAHDMRGRASVTLLWCWTTCDVDIYVEREGEMFYPTFCVCSAGRGPDTSVSVTTVLQCYNTLVSLISVAISLWHWQVMKSIISSTTRALLAVRLQSTQLIFICVSDWLCFRDRQCDCDTKSDLWLVWAADPPTQWPDCEWTISILTDTEIKYSGVLTSWYQCLCPSLGWATWSPLVCQCQCVVSLGVSHWVTD